MALLLKLSSISLVTACMLLLVPSFWTVTANILRPTGYVGHGFGVDRRGLGFDQNLRPLHRGRFANRIPACPPSASVRRPRDDSAVRMGIFDFFSNRGKGFSKLPSTADPNERVFGPPVIILWNYDRSVEDEMIEAYVEENIPKTMSSGDGEGNIILRRLDWDEKEEDAEAGIYAKEIGDYIQTVWEEGARSFKKNGYDAPAATVYKGPTSRPARLAAAMSDGRDAGEDVIVFAGGGGNLSRLYRTTSIIYVCGILPSEMVAAARALQFLQRQASDRAVEAAIAVAVPNAMSKSLGRVLEEISGDHVEATSSFQ